MDQAAESEPLFGAGLLGDDEALELEDELSDDDVDELDDDPDDVEEEDPDDEPDGPEADRLSVL